MRHRAFALDPGGREIPGALWTPAGPSEAPAALVLLGHGASGSKYESYVRKLGRSLAADYRLAAAAIDGPVHGSRRQDGDGGTRAMLDFATAWSSDPGLTDRMVEDWRRTLDALLGLPGITGPVGYFGLSMGTIFGLPFVAAEPRITAAVLGLMGMTGPTSERIRLAAPRVTCPVLFLLQWADELFARDKALELFEAIASSEKTLHANPGPHGAVPERELAESARFLAGHLVPAAE